MLRTDHRRGDGDGRVRPEGEPRHDRAREARGGSRVEDSLSDAGVVRFDFVVARPARLGPALVGVVETRGGAPESDGLRDRDSAQHETGTGENARHDVPGDGAARGEGRAGLGVGQAVGLGEAVDALAEGDRDLPARSVAGVRGTILPDSRSEPGGVRENCAEGITLGYEALGGGRRRRRRADNSLARVTLGLELGTTLPHHARREAAHDGAPVRLSTDADGPKSHNEILSHVRRRVGPIGRPAPLKRLHEVLGATAVGGIPRHERLPVTEAGGRGERRKGPISGRERAANRGDLVRARQGRRGGLRGGRRLRESERRRTEHGEESESEQRMAHGSP